ncbi:MAG: Fe(3+) ABC transporter substrate-binding protein [Longimicrobiales bacterium]
MRADVLLRPGLVRGALLAASLLLVAGCGERPDAQAEDSVDAGVVNIYSHRHYEEDQALFDRFAEQTGITVNVVTGSADELITRLENEGASTPADVLITVDAGRLHRAKSRGLLQPVESETLERQVPSHLRDAEGYWYGMTQRARVIVYAKDRVSPDSLSTYEALAGPEWRGRLLVRSSDNVYNQSLLASLIAASDTSRAEAWARGVVANMARAPSGGDTDQAKAVAAGIGDVALVNTYYVARMVTSDDAEERRAGEQLAVFFPNQAVRGTHVNVSGAGVTAHARHRQNALRLLEYLTAPDAQRALAETVFEFPVNPAVEPAALLRQWGEFRADTLTLSRLGELNAAAVRIFDRAGWR